MLTRLRLTANGARLAVGYDPDLATYYLETAPPGTLVDPADPDEGLVTVRGRVPRDLPNVTALITALDAHNIILPAEDLRALAAATGRSPVRTPRPRSSSLPPPNRDKSAPHALSHPGFGGRPPRGSGAGRR